MGLNWEYDCVVMMIILHYVHTVQWLAILGTWHNPFYDYGDGHQEDDEVWDEHHSEDANVD